MRENDRHNRREDTKSRLNTKDELKDRETRKEQEKTGKKVNTRRQRSQDQLDFRSNTRTKKMITSYFQKDSLTQRFLQTL